MVRPVPLTVIQAPTEGQRSAIWSYALASAHICTVFLMHNYFASPYVHLLVRLLLRCLPNWLFKKYKYWSSGICPCPDSSFYPSVTITCAIQTLCTSRQCLLDHLGCAFVCGLWGEGREEPLESHWIFFSGLISSQSLVQCSPALVAQKSLVTTPQAFERKDPYNSQYHGHVSTPMVQRTPQKKYFKNPTHLPIAVAFPCFK